MYAPKDLSYGELVFRESPLICGPSCDKKELEDEASSCLGCCKSSKSVKKCSQCGWPVCNNGTKCEQAKQHAEYECVYLKSKGIKYPKAKKSMRMRFLNKAIMILRALLMKQRTPAYFEELMKLPAQTNKQDAQLARTHDIFIFRLLNETLDAGSLLSATTTKDSDPEEEITKILDRITLYGYRKSINTTSSKCQGQVELVYRKTASIKRSCSPNVTVCIGPGPNFIMEVKAASMIKKNEKLTLPWHHDLYSLGTMKRQEYIIGMTGSTCTCSRCKDPTELGTFLSALKCSKCQYDYVLPKNPTKSKTTLVCTDPECPGYFRPSKSYERVDEMYSDSMRLIASNDTELGARELEEEIKNLREEGFLHPNHYIIFRLVWSLIRRKFHNLQFMDIDDMSSFLGNCQFLLTIEERLHPLFSQERAELHFYIGRVFWRQFPVYYSPDISNEESVAILDKIMYLYSWARRFFVVAQREKDLKLVSTDMLEIHAFIQKIEKK